VTHHLVGVTEIAAMLGVGRERVRQLTLREDFPAPTVVLTGQRVWERKAILDWCRATGRTVVRKRP